MPFKKCVLLMTIGLLLTSCNRAEDVVSGPQTPPVVINGVLDLEGSLLITGSLDQNRYNYIQTKNVNGIHTIIAHSKFKSAQNNFIFIDPDLNAPNCASGWHAPTSFSITDSSGNTLPVPIRERFTVLPGNEYTLISKSDLTNCKEYYIYWFGFRAGQ